MNSIRDGEPWDRALAVAFRRHAENATKDFNLMMRTDIRTMPLDWDSWRKIIDILQQKVIDGWNRIIADSTTDIIRKAVSINDTSLKLQKNLIYYLRGCESLPMFDATYDYISTMMTLINKSDKISELKKAIDALAQYLTKKISFIRKSRKAINKLIDKFDMDIKIRAYHAGIKLEFTFKKTKITVFDGSNPALTPYEISIEDRPFVVNLWLDTGALMHYMYVEMMSRKIGSTIDNRTIKKALSGAYNRFAQSLCDQPIIHPYVGNDGGSVCLGSWAAEIKDALVDFNVPRLLILLKGWSQAYNVQREPYYSITKYYHGIPDAYGRLGRYLGTDTSDCTSHRVTKVYCDKINCQVKHSCPRYESFTTIEGKELTVENGTSTGSDTLGSTSATDEEADHNPYRMVRYY